MTHKEATTIWEEALEEYKKLFDDCGNLGAMLGMSRLLNTCEKLSHSVGYGVWNDEYYEIRHGETGRLKRWNTV